MVTLPNTGTAQLAEETFGLHAGCGEGLYRLAWHNVPLKDLGLVYCSREAIHQEHITAALDHGILQQSNGHLH